MKKWKWLILNVYLPVGAAILLGVLFGIYIPTKENKEKTVVIELHQSGSVTVIPSKDFDGIISLKIKK